MSTNQSVVSFVPEDKDLDPIIFYDLNEVDLKPYKDLYTLHFISKSNKDEAQKIHSLVSKFGNLIIPSGSSITLYGTIMLYGAFVAIDITFNYQTLHDEWEMPIKLPTEYCTIDFQFSGSPISSDDALGSYYTSETHNPDSIYYDSCNTNDSCAFESYDKKKEKEKIEVEIKREFKRKITFK